MKRCSIPRVDASVPLIGDVAGTPWERAPAVAIDEFPWDETASGERTESTVVRPLYDDAALYLQYHVEDARISATATEPNGPVWEDSCVELFGAPGPDGSPHYFNFEANCVGTVHLGFGPDRRDRTLIDPDLAASIRVETSVEGPTKAPSPDDDGWWLAAALPFETLAAFTGVDVAPDSGTTWRGNFHRLDGEPDPGFAAWNPVAAPDPDFHRPDSFGRLAFE